LPECFHTLCRACLQVRTRPCLLLAPPSQLSVCCHKTMPPSSATVAAERVLSQHHASF
jgi:hypothetical protein